MSEKLIQQLRSAAGHHKKYPKGSDRGLLRLAADCIAELENRIVELDGYKERWRSRAVAAEAKMAGVERYRAVALPVRCVCDIYGSSQCRYCEYEMWRLDAILSDTPKEGE